VFSEDFDLKYVACVQF